MVVWLRQEGSKQQQQEEKTETRRASGLFIETLSKAGRVNIAEKGEIVNMLTRGGAEFTVRDKIPRGPSRIRQPESLRRLETGRTRGRGNQLLKQSQ